MGSLQRAQQVALQNKLWLLVNMQRADVFACHAMNRDVWSDAPLQQLLASHFVFVQRDERSEEGERYRRFYPYRSVPHVAVIDPRSGERVRVWGGDGEAVARELLVSELEDFVGSNSVLDDSAVRGVRGSGAASSTRASSAAAAAAAASTEDVEEHMMAAAIAASMQSEEGGANGWAQRNGGSEAQLVERHSSRLQSASNAALNRNRSLRAQQDSAFEESLALDRAKEESERSEALRREQSAQRRELKRARIPAAPCAQQKEGVREIVLRLPDGQRLQRRFFESDTIGDLYDYVEVHAPQLREGAFELAQPLAKLTFAERSQRLHVLPRRAALIVALKP
eukprot:TRINITY_DN1000_c0_g1_i1.p1 TRINITY_DN1000_c0_g1~~TRINITY_DN1000_c0_g1_i1.p1  ORF type:complete len:339 (+),score=110.98 TRINITY_DN1000_c0_g1_i1:823-1839(+)